MRAAAALGSDPHGILLIGRLRFGFSRSGTQHHPGPIGQPGVHAVVNPEPIAAVGNELS